MKQDISKIIVKEKKRHILDLIHCRHVSFVLCLCCRYILELFNPFPNKPWFLRVCSTILLKTLWEKENCSIRAISPFPIVVSTCVENFLPLSSNLKLSPANSFSLEESKI